MIKKIYIVHHTHFDIGYTDLPEEVVQQHACNIDTAIRLAHENPSFRWTLESGRFVEDYLERRPQEACEALLELLRNGRFEVEALNMQMLTETASSAELVRNVSLTADAARRHGYSVDTAMLDDIGGYSCYLPSILSQYGVKYFVAGVGACQAYLPWAKLPHLFRHRSPDGRSVLVWNLGIDRTLPPEKADNMAVYSQGMVYLLWPLLMGKSVSDASFCDEAEEHWKKLLDRLEREQYPYEELMLQTGLDNGGPNDRLVAAIELLNSSGRFPEIVLATPREFFAAMEGKYGAQIPELSGVLTDAWILRMNHVPSVCKDNRCAQRHYQAALLWGAAENKGLLEDMMLVADHTFGLFNWLWQERLAQAHVDGQREGMRSSVFDRLRDSWAAKALYGANAARQARRFWNGTVGRVSGLGEAVFSVRNGSPHDVSGYAECYGGNFSRELLRLMDSDGREVPFQKNGYKRYVVRADNVPAGGSLSLIPEFTKERCEDRRKVDGPVPTEMTFGRMSVSFDDGGLPCAITEGGIRCNDGLVGELWAEELLDMPLVNTYSSMSPVRQRRVWREEAVTARLADDGPLFVEIVRNGRICRAVFEEHIRIWKEGGRIDFSVRLDKPECPLKESYYVAFPMKYAAGGGLYYDQNAGVVNVCRDLLPGACQELFYCSRYAAVEGGDVTSVLCVHDSPIVCFGGMNLCKWERELPFKPGDGHLYNIIYNNVCNTDAPCWQEILDTFRYSLFVRRGGFSPVAAQECVEAASALSCELSAPSGFRAIEGFPKELRLHPVGGGEFWLENLSEACADYDFTLLGRRFKGSLEGRDLRRL